MLVSELLAGLSAKLAGIGLAAKATLGLGIAATAVTGAGAAGVLPDPAQHAVASVVNAISPVNLPDPTLSVNVDTTGTPKVSVPGSLLAGDESDDSDDEGDDEGEGAKDNHGACVSAIAKDKTAVGREHGEAVSTAARSDCGKEDKGTSTSSTSSTSSTTTTALSGQSVAGQSDDGTKGKGNSGSGSENKGQGSTNSGSGSANSGRGNSNK